MFIHTRQRKRLVLKTTLANFKLYDKYIWKNCAVAKHRAQVNLFSLLTKPYFSLKHSANPARKKFLTLLQ